MAKIIAAINMTVDGFCDHTYGIADEESHQHYTDLLSTAGALLYGRTTYQLMEDFWPTLLSKPSGQKELDDFAVAIDKVPKIVFSRTLTSLNWKTARLATRTFDEEIGVLKQQPSADVFIGSPGLIAQATRADLIDEFQLAIHPVIAGKGLPLFRDLTSKVELKLLRTKSLRSGIVIHYYEPTTR